MQQFFRLLIFLIQPYMFLTTNSHILKSTFWLYIHGYTVAPVGSSVGALYQNLYLQSKSAPEDGRICYQKHLGLN